MIIYIDFFIFNHIYELCNNNKTLWQNYFSEALGTEIQLPFFFIEIENSIFIDKDLPKKLTIIFNNSYKWYYIASKYNFNSVIQNKLYTFYYTKIYKK